jgi:YspA, cpYpsA-related SLOG family
MRVIIAGSRSFHNYTRLCEIMEQLIPSLNITEVVSGCANGVDRLGERWAQARGIPVKRFPADWNAFGRSAGPIRNKQMAQYADALIAIKGSAVSRGTDNMIEQARKAQMAFIYVANEFPTE